MAVTMEEKLEAVKPIVDFFSEYHKDKTIVEFRTVWEKAYSTVGHKVLARILLGQSAEEALRTNGRG